MMDAFVRLSALQQTESAHAKEAKKGCHSCIA